MKVTFFLHNSPLMTVHYPRSMPEHLAVADAKREFERQMQTVNWNDVADSFRSNR